MVESMVTEEDALKAMNWLVENASTIAQAASDVEHLREYRKSLKAMLMENSGRESVASSEMHAYAHPDYRNHLNALKEAVFRHERLKYLYRAAETKIEVWRTVSANARNVR